MLIIPLTMSYFLARAFACVLLPEPYGPISTIRGDTGACDLAGRLMKSITLNKIKSIDLINWYLVKKINTLI